MTEAGSRLPPRESMDFDVVIVGAGPAGLAAAIRLKQLSRNFRSSSSKKALKSAPIFCPAQSSILVRSTHSFPIGARTKTGR